MNSRNSRILSPKGRHERRKKGECFAPLNALPVPMLRQVFLVSFLSHFFGMFSGRSFAASRKAFCALLVAKGGPKLSFWDRFSRLLGIPAHMRERCSRCSGSSIWRVGGGQRIDVFSMFFSESKKGVSLSMLLRSFAILGALRKPIGFQNGSKRRPKKGELALH